MITKSEAKRIGVQKGIHPLSDWVLVSLDVQKETVTDTGIVIPEDVITGTDRTRCGVVLAFGPNCKSSVEVGSTVVLDSYDQKACEIDVTTIMVREDNILAVKS
jgi:co-chaperonin GroES (HSP10)